MAHNTDRVVLGDEFLEFCETEKQEEAVKAVQEAGSIQSAAHALNISRSSIRGRLDSVRRRAAKKGVFPETRIQVPAGMEVARRSAHYGPDGKYGGETVRMVSESGSAEELDRLPNAPVDRQSMLLDGEGRVRQVWHKKKATDEQKALAWDIIGKELCEKIPRVSPLAGPSQTNEQLCNVYTLTDCHMGMLAWHEEGGADWDVAIAERTICGVFEDLIVRSPEAKTGIVAQLGDFLHYDSIEAVTPTSGHILDADTRFEKLVRVATRTLRRVIDMALQKHEEVYVLMAEGNHDIASSAWLRCMFAALYENEPRVTVNTSPLPYYCTTHGKVMLFWHHGHKKKPDQLRALAAAQFAPQWGQTEFRYAHSGDKHHRQLKDTDGMTVEQHATIAARDAYAARGGFYSLRNAHAITYHKKYGELGRVVASPEMVAA